MPAADHTITLLTRVGCQLCAEARVQLAAICADTGAGWDEVDVDGDSELRGEYGDRLPVFLIDGIEHGYGRIEESRLRAALSR